MLRIYTNKELMSNSRYQRFTMPYIISLDSFISSVNVNFNNDIRFQITQIEIKLKSERQGKVSKYHKVRK